MTNPSTAQQVEVDGAFGEGGGQILRTALSLSMCRQRPFRIRRIRKARARPGLQPQHRMAVEAAAAISGAATSGAEVGSTELVFRPGPVVPGEYAFDIGTAGSTSLVLQTVLPALLCAAGPSRVTLHGGTHNPHAPPYEFLAHAFLPLLRRMGVDVSLAMERPGYYPKGGGCLVADITPTRRLARLDLNERGPVRQRGAVATLSHLPEHIARRELEVLRRALGLAAAETAVRHADTAYGAGNYVTVTVASEQITEVFTGFGQRGVPAEAVAAGVAEEVATYLRAGVPVGVHLADQLLLPMALAGAGGFITVAPTLHATTNMAVIGQFLEVGFSRTALGDGRWRIEVGGP